MKKYFMTMVVMAVFAIGFAASDEDESSNSSSSSESRTEQEQKNKNDNSFLGTYEVTDKVGCTIHVTLNEDGTATITGVKGEGITYYCTWRDHRKYDRGIFIIFSDLDKIPKLYFEGGTKYSADCYICDGWFYWSVTPDTKNPEWRLKATKIR